MLIFVDVKRRFGLSRVSGAGEIYTVAPPGSQLSKDLGVRQLGGILDYCILDFWILDYCILDSRILERSRWQDTVSVTNILNNKS